MGGHIWVTMCTYHSWGYMAEYKCYRKWKSQNVLTPFEQSINKVYHQSKQQCSSATKMYYGDFTFVFSPLYISLVLCKLVRWNLQKNYPEYIAISSLHKTDNVNMTFLGTSKIPRVTKLLKSYTDPSLASKKSSSSPLLESNSSHVFFPTARVRQLTRLLPHCSSRTAHVFPTPHCSSSTAHTSSSPLLESNSSHVFFPTARVQQLTRLLPHCSSPTAYLKESQSSEWCCN